MLINGVLLVDKPFGITSHDVVARIRRASGQRHVGHAGTLDPLATGMMLLCLGKATRISEYLLGHDKSYRAYARLGWETETYDSEGKPAAGNSGFLPRIEKVREILPFFEGELEQLPPPYSAVKVQGRPLYEYAREGRSIHTKPRKVMIYSLEADLLEESLLMLSVACSSGTYVRSLVHDLGIALGCGAYLAGLRRLSVGPFLLPQTMGLNEVETRLRAGDASFLLSITDALMGMRHFRLDSERFAKLAHGQAIAADAPETDGLYMTASDDGGTIVIAEWNSESGLWHPCKVIREVEDIH